jgi:hypothetical protein
LDAPQPQSQEVLVPADFDLAFAAFGRERTDALVVLDESFTLLHAKRQLGGFMAQTKKKS